MLTESPGFADSKPNENESRYITPSLEDAFASEAFASEAFASDAFESDAFESDAFESDASVLVAVDFESAANKNQVRGPK